MGDGRLANTVAPRGRAVDVLGEPIPGAVLLARCAGTDVQQVRTGGDGAFHFAPIRVPPGEWLEVVAEAPGRQRRSLHWRSGDSPADLELPEACELAGIVTDEHGAALAGVEVTARHSGQWSDRQITRTDAGGGFRFDGVAIGRTTVMAFRDGWQLAVVEHRAGGGETAAIRLQRAHGRWIRFRIHGATREQLEQARCVFFDTADDLPPSCREGRPDANGEWIVRGLPNEREYGSLQVVVPGARCEPFHRCPPHPESGGYEFDFTISEKKATVLRGRLVGADGAPLAAVPLLVRSNLDWDSTVVTNAQGRFVATTYAPPGEIVAFELLGGELVLDGPGLAEFRSPKGCDLHRVRLPSDGEIVLRAVTAAALRVECVDDRGAPCAGAWVSVEIAWQPEPGRTVSSQLATGTTSAAGFMELRGLHPQPGATVSARVSFGSACVSTTGVQLVPGAMVAVHAVVPPLGSLRGTVRDAAGRPLAGEPIGVYRAPVAERDWPIVEATSDRAGRYAVRSLAPGTYRFGCVNPQRLPPWLGEPFRVEAGAPACRDVIVPDERVVIAAGERLERDVTEPPC